jgi:hypothetical protein
LTSGGDWETKEKAKKLGKYVEGRFNEMDIYTRGAKIMLDCFIFGTGVFKWFEEDDQITGERVFPGEIWVDEQTALTAEPRTLVQRKYVDVHVLTAMYPKYGFEIKNASQNATYISNEAKYDPEQVEVVEIWHLPSGKDAKDGKHAICINSATLFCEEYTREWFPFSFVRYSEQPLGFFGQGLTEDLEGIQIEVNKLVQRIQESMHLFSNTIVFTPKGANLKKGHYKNINGLILEYEGQVPPKVEMPGSVSSEVFTHLQWLYAKGYEISGISQLSAASKKPSGVESGVALRTLLDVETQRFSMTSRSWENFFLDATKKLLEMSADLYEDRDHKVKWDAGTFIEEIDWSEVNMDKDQYVLKVFPTSMLPAEPAGRLAHIEQLIQAGLINDPNEARALLDYPDLERYESFEQASKDAIEQAISTMLIKGKYVEPREFENLSMGIKKMSQAWTRARADGAPSGRLDLLEQWMMDADAILNPPPPPAPPEPLGGQGGPMETPPQPLGPEGAALLAPGGPPELPPGGEMMPPPMPGPPVPGPVGL